MRGKARAAYLDNPDKDDIDFMWFLWGGEKSPLCGRKLKTLSVNTWTKKVCGRRSQILITASIMMKVFAARFFMNLGFMMTIPISSMDIHRSMPLKGKNPVRAKGRLFVIDGGFCRSMNKATGIAGYTLIFNSHGLRLKAHTPFTSVEDALMNNTDIESSSEIIEKICSVCL